MTTPLNDVTHMAALLMDAALRFDRRTDSFALGKATVCRDIAERILQHGRFASSRQQGYAEALIRWSEQGQPTPGALRAAATADARSEERQRSFNLGIALPRIVQLIGLARAAGLQSPKIRLRKGEWRIKVYPAPAYGRHPGAFYVKASSATARNLYCGMIQPDGRFMATPDCPLDVMTALREFNADPASVATAYGRALGSCCFCGLPLTDGRSVAMGYGPVCAQNYGLPWGDERTPSHVVAEGTPVNAEGLPADPVRDVLRRQGFAGGRRQGRSEAVRAALARIRARRAEQEGVRRANDAAFQEARGSSPVPDRPRGQAPLTSNVPLDAEDEDSHFM